VKYWCLFVGTFILQSSVFSHWFIPQSQMTRGKENSSDTYLGEYNYNKYVL